MIKVAIIGAGSAVFATQLMTDILTTPALDSGVIALVDIDPERLKLAHQMAKFLIDCSGRNWMVEASLDRTDVLAGSDYVISTIEVAGRENVRHDYDIPLKYGVDQCIGDTIGPGGLFKALRTLPDWLAILRDVERLAPNALVMNYTNPMSLTVLAGLRASSLPIVGLCHSIQSTSHALARYLDLPCRELDWRAGGINHMAWFTRLEYEGMDQYPKLRRRMEDPTIYEQDPIRFEIMQHLGAFCTESSGHVSEYMTYFRKRPDLVQMYTRPGYRGESGFYANNWPEWRRKNDEGLRAILNGEKEYRMKRSEEYASYIIEAIETGVPAVIYGNVLNEGLISNLPQDGVVEVACLVDNKGIQPTRFGPLPTHMALLNQQHMAFHDLTVTAVLQNDREAAAHALMVDPLTSAVCSLAEIRALFNEMIGAQQEFLPRFLLN